MTNSLSSIRLSPSVPTVIADSTNWWALLSGSFPLVVSGKMLVSLSLKLMLTGEDSGSPASLLTSQLCRKRSLAVAKLSSQQAPIMRVAATNSLVLVFTLISRVAGEETQQESIAESALAINPGLPLSDNPRLYLNAEIAETQRAAESAR